MEPCWLDFSRWLTTVIHTETTDRIIAYYLEYYLKNVITVNREYFDVKIFLDSMACAKIECTKYMRNINDNAIQGRLSENYLTRKIIAWNILDTKYSRFTVHVYMYM